MIWAVNFIAAKIGLRSFPPLTMASFRVCAAGAVMVPFYLALKKLRLTAFAEATAARKRGFTRRDVWTFLYLGFFGVSVNQFCFTLGLHYTSVSHSAVIVGMGPIYTLILAVLLRVGKRPVGIRFVGMAIAFTGHRGVGFRRAAYPRTLPRCSATPLPMTGSLGFADLRRSRQARRLRVQRSDDDAPTTTFAGALAWSFLGALSGRDC